MITDKQGQTGRLEKTVLKKRREDPTAEFEGSRRSPVQAERQYRTIFEAAGTAMIIVEEDTTISLVNGEFVRLSGYSHEEIEGRMSWMAFVSVGDHERLLSCQRARRIDPASTPRQYEFDFIDRNSGVHNISGSEIMIPDSGQSVISCQDMTEIRKVIAANARMAAADEIVRKQTEDALRKSEKRLADIVNLLPDATFAIDLDGKITIWNRAAEDFTGAKAVDMLGKGNREYAIPFYDEIRPMLIDLVLTPSLQIEKLYPSVKRIDGKVVGESYTRNIKHGEAYILGIAAPLYDSEGRIVGAIESVRDISDRKRAEEEVLFSNTILRTQQEASPDGILVVGEDRKILSCNRRFVEMWCIPADVVASGSDELALQSVLDRVVKPEEFLELVRYLYEHPEEKSQDIIDLVGGITFERYSAPMFGVDKRNYGRVWYFRDITERRQAEEAFRQSEERFRQIFEQGQAAVMLLNSISLAVIDANAAAEQLYGFTREELIKSGAEIVFAPGEHEEFRKFIGEVRSNGRSYIAKKLNVRKNGAKILIAIRGQLIHLQGEKVVFCSFMDVTKKVQKEREAREAEAKLIHANKMASLGMLVSGIAHEINNPNSFIRGNAAILEKIWQEVVPILADYQANVGNVCLAGFPFDQMKDVVPRLLKGLGDGAHRISAIVSNLKDYARKDATIGRSVFDVNAVIRAAAMILSHHILRHTDNFRLELADTLPPAYGKAQQVEQVVINLVMNALHALTAKSAGVTVTSRLDLISSTIEVAVRDEGHGMTKEVMERLTEPFFSTKLERGGSGLGLSISETIIKGHSGTLRFESTPGRGTLAIFNLPVWSVNEKRSHVIPKKVRP